MSVKSIQLNLSVFLKMVSILRFLLIFLAIHSLDTSRSTVLLDSFTLCETNKKFPLQFTNFSAYNRRGKTYISTQLLVTETIKGPIEQEVFFERCDMQSTKCWGVPKISVADQCPRMNVSYFASNFFAKLTPPVYNCPIKMVRFRRK